MDEEAFSLAKFAALALADASTKAVRIPDGVFENCRSFWTEAEVQEIIM